MARAGSDPSLHDPPLRDPSLFDASWYLDRYPEVALASLDAARHFATTGEAAGYRPNPLFHTDWYRARHRAELEETGLGPLAHYERVGEQRGDRPNPLFDPAWYARGLATPVGALAHYLSEGAGRRDPHPLFDTAWYLERYPEVEREGWNPLAHFLDVGAQAGYDPHPDASLARLRAEAGDAGPEPWAPLLVLGERVVREGLDAEALLRPRSTACVEPSPNTLLAEGRLGRALVVDACLPTPARDSRSLRMLHLLRMLRDLGLAPTFLPENLSAPEPCLAEVTDHGIRVVHAPETASVEAFLDAEGRSFDLCVVSRPRVAERWLMRVRTACPRARVVFDAADLMEPEAFAAGLARARRGNAAGVFSADGFLAALEPEVDAIAPDLACCSLPRVYEVSEPCSGFAGRRGLLLVTGFQAAPDLDGLLFLLDEVLPRVAVPPSDLRVHVPDTPWAKGIAAQHGFALLSESQSSSRDRYERFRLAVAPTRFGAALSGRLLPAMAAGLPCLASPVAARDLAPVVRAGLREARDGDAFVRAIDALSAVESEWLEASRRARAAVARRYAYETMRERVRTLLARLGFAVA